MAHCRSCDQTFQPKKPYHRYCDACYADMMAERRMNELFRFRREREAFEMVRPFFWLLAFAILIYVLGALLGLW